MKRVLILINIVLFVSIGISAQTVNAFISFKESAHDFGKIKEEKGPVTYTFEFVNTGSNILLIQNTQASCGCTTPEHSKAPVKPGEKGFVKVVYDPNGRPGQFIKDITVYSNAENSPVVLKISGTVIPHEPTVEEAYRYIMGDIRLKSSHLGFNNTSPGKTKTDSISFLNTGKNAAKLEFMKVPSHLKIKVVPATVKPGKSGLIIITYDAKVRNDWGFLIDYIYLKINGIEKPDYKITVTADIREDFSNLNDEQRASAPKIITENKTYNFGNVKAGSVVEYEFTFKNQGKSDLHIRKITPSCTCVTTELKGKVIKPGASGSIKAKYNTTGNKNAQSKTITVTTNDPSSQFISLLIKGVVE